MQEASLVRILGAAGVQGQIADPECMQEREALQETESIGADVKFTYILCLVWIIILINTFNWKGGGKNGKHS